MAQAKKRATPHTPMNFGTGPDLSSQRKTPTIRDYAGLSPTATGLMTAVEKPKSCPSEDLCRMGGTGATRMCQDFRSTTSREPSLQEGQEVISQRMSVSAIAPMSGKDILVRSQQSSESERARRSGTSTKGSDGINIITFEPHGFSSVPREPENLDVNDKETLVEILESRGAVTGHPHRIPGTLAQSKVVSMLLDTGAASSLMPHQLFLELRQFKPNLTLASTKRALHGVDGSQLRVRGIAVVDVEFAGQYVLVPFTVVDMVNECILGMDFLRQNDVQWNIGKGELCIGKHGTVYTRRATTDPVIPCSRALLATRTFVPASSLAKVEVTFRSRGMSLPNQGILSMVGKLASRYGVVVGRTIVSPENGKSTVFVMNPTETAVELPKGITVGVLEQVTSIQATDPETMTTTVMNSVSENKSPTFNRPDESCDSEDESGYTELGYEGCSEASISLLESELIETMKESALRTHAKAAAFLNPSGSRHLTVDSPLQDYVVSDPEGLSKFVEIGMTQAEDKLVVEPEAGASPFASKATKATVDGGEDNSVPEHLRKLYNATADELESENDRYLLRQVLRRNADIFATTSTDLGSTNVATHSINTGDSPPIKQAPRRVALHRQQIVKQEVEKMLEKEIIEPGDGPWSSPIVLAKKKDGTLRFCIDYRKLNDVTLKDAYPLPRIEDNLDTLSGSSWFSTLDLISGFWQVEMDDESRLKTAFSVGHGGLYQFRRMPFGLCNAPATFQRLMEKVLAGLQWQIAVLYIDDIVVFGSSVAEHLERLETIFSRLRKAGLKLKPSKCTLLKRKVDFLGHTVSARGVEADPTKISKVKDWPQPKNVSEVRSFIGLCAYYRRFVKGFSDVCKPLYHLTEKGVAFHWGDEQDKAFKALKMHLTTAPILAFPNEKDEFILDTDASGVGIGAVLSQVQNGEERVIAYGSRVLSKPERNYCVTRRELLAIVVFVKMFHHYLVGSHFTLRTDHAALYWLFGTKNLEGQPARWVERLGCYDMTIQHRPGKKHGNADALSRCPPRCDETQLQTGPMGSELNLTDFQAIRHFTVHDGLDETEVDFYDSEWSDDEWEDDEPLSSERLAMGELTWDERPCICRVQTRAQAKLNNSDELDISPPAELPCRTRKKKATKVAAPSEGEQGNSASRNDPAEGEKPEARKPTDPAKRSVGRPPLDTRPTLEEILELQNQQQFLRNTPPFNWSDEEIAHMQTKDSDVAKLREWVAKDNRPIWQEVAKESYALKTWWGRFDQLFLSENGVLYLIWEPDSFSFHCPRYRIVTPRALRPYILKELHDTKTAGHLGIRKTRARAFASRFFWPGMSAYIGQWVRNCLSCGALKRPQYNRRQPMQPYYVGAKLDTVSIDILGPFKPRTSRGNVCILTITDHFTRWVNAYPLRDATADKLARCVVDFIAQFGVPKHLHSDQGSNVDGEVIREVCKILGISKTRTCPYHPAGNGITERENKVIVDMLRHFVNTRQSDWDIHLPVIMMAYRSSVHRVIGESPASMMYGHELRLPIDALVGPPPEEEHEAVATSDYVQNLVEALQTAHETARTRLESHYRYEKKQYDRKVNEEKFTVGQAVWLRLYPKTTTKSKKLMKSYSGPHIVLSRVSAVTYKIKLSRQVDKVVHGDRLKPFHGVVNEPFLKKLWVPLAKGPGISDKTGAYEGVSSVFEGAINKTS